MISQTSFSTSVCTSEMGRVSTDVETGDSSQPLTLSMIRKAAIENPQTTMATQTNLANFCFSPPICCSPWMVEVSRNSRKSPFMEAMVGCQFNTKWFQNLPISGQSYFLFYQSEARNMLACKCTICFKYFGDLLQLLDLRAPSYFVLI